MIFARWRRRAPEVAVDLGTAFTRVYARGRGLLADEPSRAVRPALRAGAIVDTEAATLLLQRLLWRARGSARVQPAVLVCAPSDARPHEVEALREATHHAGASTVKVAPEPLAAALGGGLDIASRYAQMIVDVGDGVTDVGVVRSGGLASSWALRMGCGELRAAVTEVAARHGLRLRPGEAERLAGAAQGEAGLLLASGTDAATGREARAWVRARDVADAVEPLLTQLAATVRSAWRDLSPEASCEVIESGVLLAGGGALIRGLRERIAAETALDVRPAADPLHAVILGARRMVEAGASGSALG